MLCREEERLIWRVGGDEVISARCLAHVTDPLEPVRAGLLDSRKKLFTSSYRGFADEQSGTIKTLPSPMFLGAVAAKLNQFLSDHLYYSDVCPRLTAASWQAAIPLPGPWSGNSLSTVVKDLKMLDSLRNLGLLALGCRRGAAMVEYALLAGFVALVAVISVTNFGTNLNAKFVAIVATM